jgi:hypothetical protein
VAQSRSGWRTGASIKVDKSIEAQALARLLAVVDVDRL